MGLCERFHCLPSELLKEDAELIRLLKIISIANPPDEGGEYYGE